jgi:DNA-directed RNA polymerase subunit N (RpoN/RPB10)
MCDLTQNSYARLKNRTGRRVIPYFGALGFFSARPNSLSAEELGVKCFYCQSNRLRLSHFHLFDIPRLLILQLPVRCRSCGERFYAIVFEAWKLGLTKKAGIKPAQDNKDEPAVRGNSPAA